MYINHPLSYPLLRLFHKIEYNLKTRNITSSINLRFDIRTDGQNNPSYQASEQLKLLLVNFV